MGPCVRTFVSNAYSLAFSGGIESPYYSICRDNVLGRASVDEVAAMYVLTSEGEITCTNAHACVGCPYFANLLRSCPLLGSEGEALGATRDDPLLGSESEAVGATRDDNSNKRKRSPGPAKRKRRSTDTKNSKNTKESDFIECHGC